ncbi:LacI family DNA-binding transcriptional regulator [Xylocopilactobacillus apis]|uniref:Transcriptional regulator n=1 Tax=Xylocopilactobacillus apis TaxID=2932183 RepID=A0AAU9D2N9_9LACO|nr:LacI family DNA-binding transcriptional regulator [Xylocopilactobacillus apis]BDR55660.1 transcriptional regulator [Xylocopilactobacillus apis]
MTNIRDIAKLSGYSVSTVSRYLSHHGYVSKEAQEVISSVIRKTDYMPNEIARELSNGKNLTIGVVVPHIRHPYFNYLISGITKSAFNAQYKVLMLPSNYNVTIERRYLELLHQKAFDAIIFTSHKLPLTELQKYQKYGPVICCENPQQVPIAAAYSLRTETFVKAFEQIKKNNFKKIILILSRNIAQSATAQTTIAAYEKVFKKLPVKEQIISNTFSFQHGYEIAKKISLEKKQTEFLFCNNDDVAAGIYQYYNEQKLTLPGIMGQENQPIGKILNISTIDHHLETVGELAGKLAISGKIQQIPVESTLIWR